MTSRFLDKLMVFSFTSLVGSYVYFQYKRPNQNNIIPIDSNADKSQNKSLVEQGNKVLDPITDSLLKNQSILSGNTKILSEIFDLGYPGPISDIRCHEQYVASYNRMLRIPNYVIEKLTKDTFSVKAASRTKSEFKEDLLIPKKFRAKLNDYINSGYDRGHMVPAADTKNNQKAMNETFLLSNIAPQVGVGFNRHYWAYFERFCRSLVFNPMFKDIYIVTGPLFLPMKDPSFPNKNKYYVQYEVIGNPPNIAVPTHFYKIILGVKNKNNSDSNNKQKNEYYVQAFVFPNKEIPDNVDLKRFIVPIEAVEKASGLEFFNNVRAKMLELCSFINCKIEIPKTPYSRNNKLIDRAPK